MKMDYDECRAKISIIDIAEDLGYTRISGRQATNLTYVLGTPKNPEDEIVIFPKKNISKCNNNRSNRDRNRRKRIKSRK